MDNLSSGPANWFYVLDSRRQGPFDRNGLVRELLALEAPEGVLVWRTGLPAWTKAGILDELKRELPPPLPGALDEPPETSPLDLPDLPTEEDETSPAAPEEGQDSSPDGGSEATTAEGEAEEGTTAEQRRRRRRHRKPRASGPPSYLLPLVLLFLAVMLGLWFLLRRMNEVPPGRIIQQGDVGVTGLRSGASPG
jgi:hypothetical protein